MNMSLRKFRKHFFFQSLSKSQSVIKFNTVIVYEDLKLLNRETLTVKTTAIKKKNANGE